MYILYEEKPSIHIHSPYRNRNEVDNVNLYSNNLIFVDMTP